MAMQFEATHYLRHSMHTVQNPQQILIAIPANLFNRSL